MKFKMFIIAGALAVAGVTGCDSGTPAPKSDAPKEEAKAKTGDAEDKKEDAKTGDEKVELPIEAKGPVARVNGEEIPAAEFNKEVKRLARMAASLPPAAIDKFKTNTIDRLVDQKIVEAELSKTKFEATDAEIQEELDRFKAKMGGPEGVERFFSQAGITEEELKSDIGRSIVLKKYLRDNYGVGVEDKEAKEYYEQNLKRFTQEEQVKASHILIKVEKNASKEVLEEKKKKAKEIYKQAKADGADFAALAKEHSEGPTGPRGGDLGFFSRKRMVPAFSEAAFKTKPGNITGPVKTEFGYHVIKVTDHKPEKVSSFDEVKSDIVENLERTEMRDGMEKLIKKLKAEAKIEKLDSNIEKNPNFKPKQQAPMGMPGMGGGHPPIPKGNPNAPKPPAPKPTGN